MFTKDYCIAILQQIKATTNKIKRDDVLTKLLESKKTKQDKSHILT